MHEKPVELPVSSSTPPSFSPEQEACYRDVLEALNRSGTRYAIGGAFALHEHSGIWRNTKDLDLILEPASIPHALEQLDKLGFTTFVEDPVWLAKAYRGEYFVDLITAVGNAVLTVETSWLDRATPCELFHVPCRVMGAEELIACKLFVSRRERFDGADVAHLLHARAQQLDWSRIESLLSEHWELLLWALVFFAYVYPSQKRAIPREVWNGLIERFSSGLLHSSDSSGASGASGSFRGTLIDPNMFAIDVKEWGEPDTYYESCLRQPRLLKMGPEDPRQKRKRKR